MVASQGRGIVRVFALFPMNMSRLSFIAASAALLCAASSAALAQQSYPATLTGHAVLPALTMIAAPKDAPHDLQVAGKFTTPRRVDAVGSVMGQSGGRDTGVPLPFQSGQFNRHKTIFLHDPDKKIPFRITHEGTSSRYLTGADFDPESFQFAGGALWIGDEFGPFLIKADLNGKVLGVFETQVDGKTVRSPDAPGVLMPGAPDAKPTAFVVKRSKGYEGMAASKDGSKLYALLEGALWNDDTKAYENVGGKQYMRVLEFDVKTEQWTGRHWKYVLEANHHAIGDFNMIDGTTGLIIERDNGEGTAHKACPEGQKRTDCFHDLAKFKRVYKVEMSDANVGGEIRKAGYIDLMNIQDPQRLAKKPLNNGVLTFPFFTIENVDIVDGTHIVVGNDNNLPFSSSRDPNKADDNELVLLEVGGLLQAK